MEDGLDIRELKTYEKELLDLAQRDLPKETKKFLKKEGKKLSRRTISKAKQKTNKKTGAYYKGIKVGKVYKYRGDGGISVRVFGKFHAYLIEYGHRMVVNPGPGKGRGKGRLTKAGKGIGREVGFVPGLNVFGESEREFQPVFFDDVKDFIDKVVDKL